MNYEVKVKVKVKGEARTRKVTPGEMALMRGAVALLSEMHPVIPGDMVVEWSNSRWLRARSEGNGLFADCRDTRKVFEIVSDALGYADPADLALLMDLVRTSEVDSLIELGDGYFVGAPSEDIVWDEVVEVNDEDQTVLVELANKWIPAASITKIGGAAAAHVSGITFKVTE